MSSENSVAKRRNSRKSLAKKIASFQNWLPEGAAGNLSTTVVP